jgi:deoxyribonuclease V
MPNISDYFSADTSRKSLLASQNLVSKMAVVKDDFGELEVKERIHSIQPWNYPYIPTFLSFREGPVIVNTFTKLKMPPDILMVDGAGVNHPRSM